jgi:predicted secreted protein
VVVDQFNVTSVRSFKTKNDAPVGSHGHGPKPFQVAFKRMQTITGKIELLRSSCIIKYGQYFLNRIRQIRAYPAAVVTFKEPFQAAMLDAPNHQNTP